MKINANELGLFLKNSTRKQAAFHFKCSYATITRMCKKNGFDANLELTQQAQVEGGKKGASILHTLYNLSGENNPNWKNGISKNHYHYKKIQAKRYPEKIKARELVNRALKMGKLKKTCCIDCGSNDVFAHHEDYSKPLEVIWLCRKHHRERHNNKH